MTRPAAGPAVHRRTVALVASSYAPYVGGVEEHVRNVARELRAAGDDVVVWTVARTSDERDDVVDGVRVRRLRAPLPTRGVRGVLGFAAAAPGALLTWLRAVRGDRPDVLHVHCYGPNGPWATLTGALARRPVVLSAHGETFMDAQDVFRVSRVMPRALRTSLRRARAVTGCSRLVLDELERGFGLPPGAGLVVPNGVGAVEPSDAAVPPGDPYLLAVGRVVATKGFDLLLEAYARTVAGRVRLVVGGDGPEVGALRALARARGVEDRVVFLGVLSSADVAAVMGRALALVVPSRVEAFGIVVLEGWRAGVPVVVTSRGGPAEFVEHGRTGLLVDPLDEPALDAALEQVVGDADLRRRLAEGGSREVLGYDWASVARRYARVYADVAVHGRARAGSHV